MLTPEEARKVHALDLMLCCSAADEDEIEARASALTAELGARFPQPLRLRALVRAVQRTATAGMTQLGAEAVEGVRGVLEEMGLCTCPVSELGPPPAPSRRPPTPCSWSCAPGSASRGATWRPRRGWRTSCWGTPPF